MIAGVLVVDKPQGLTSHDVVAAARRVLRERRIGHCGTLDPMATGVLALAVGPATRLVQFLSGEVKHYDAVVRFGEETTTYDATGDVVATSALRPTREALDAALAQFRGPLSQLPPAYSAKKVGGVRAYALARQPAAEPPALRPASVVCHDLAVRAFDGERLRVSLVVSAGFYVRSFAHDLGRALGTGAVLEALRRTRSGDFDLAGALPFDDLVRADAGDLAARVRPMHALLAQVPAVALSPAEAVRVRHGADVAVPGHWGAVPPLARLLDPEGRLVALAVPAPRPGALHPSVVLG